MKTKLEGVVFAKPSPGFKQKLVNPVLSQRRRLQGVIKGLFPEPLQDITD
jgi:hypothetical protein